MLSRDAAADAHKAEGWAMMLLMLIRQKAEL